MVNTIDMQDLRYLNLFGQITRISTRHCFEYNNQIVFCVPKMMVAKAVGENGANAKRISSIIKKRVKIIPLPRDDKDIESFIKNIVSPVEFNGIEVTDDEVILNAGSQSKAALIGRNKRRLKEMEEIVENFFKREFKIV